MKKVIIIAGPTAVGKSDLAIKLAKKLNTEIISADSMQIYRKMDIGTAKIKEEEMDGIVCRENKQRRTHQPAGQ